MNSSLRVSGEKYDIDISNNNITLDYFFYLASKRSSLKADYCDIDIFSYDNIPKNNILEKLSFRGNRITNDGLQVLLKNFKALTILYISDWWDLTGRKINVEIKKNRTLIEAEICGEKVDASFGNRLRNVMKRIILKEFLK
jgi:hypothetical protein